MNLTHEPSDHLCKSFSFELENNRNQTAIPAFPPNDDATKVVAMLYYTLIFLVIALVAGALGFGGIAGASAGIAQILFFVFLGLLALSLIAGIIRKV